MMYREEISEKLEHKHSKITDMTLVETSLAKSLNAHILIQLSLDRIILLNTLHVISESLDSGLIIGRAGHYILPIEFV